MSVQLCQVDRSVIPASQLLQNMQGIMFCLSDQKVLKCPDLVRLRTVPSKLGLWTESDNLYLPKSVFQYSSKQWDKRKHFLTANIFYVSPEQVEQGGWWQIAEGSNHSFKTGSKTFISDKWHQRCLGNTSWNQEFTDIYKRYRKLETGKFPLVSIGNSVKAELHHPINF